MTAWRRRLASAAACAAGVNGRLTRVDVLTDHKVMLIRRDALANVTMVVGALRGGRFTEFGCPAAPARLRNVKDRVDDSADDGCPQAGERTGSRDVHRIVGVCQDKCRLVVNRVCNPAAM